MHQLRRIRHAPPAVDVDGCTAPQKLHSRCVCCPPAPNTAPPAAHHGTQRWQVSAPAVFLRKQTCFQMGASSWHMQAETAQALRILRHDSRFKACMRPVSTCKLRNREATACVEMWGVDCTVELKHAEFSKGSSDREYRVQLVA